MRYTQTGIPGAFLIEIEPTVDERGIFARTFCRDELEGHGLNGCMVQQSVSWNAKAGTLRGMHYQASPFEEEKLVRVTQGVAFDVIVDVRPESPAFCHWFGIELSAVNRRQLYIPKGVAHGFLTLTDSTEMFYEMTVPYHPDSARGLRWNDPAFAIKWPQGMCIMSERDKNYPLFQR